jgi:hypothetical protein
MPSVRQSRRSPNMQTGQIKGIKLTMRRSVFLVLSLALSVACTAAQAQDLQAAAPPACELHFWPASAVNTYPQPAQAQGGLVWALALGGKKRAEALRAVRSDIASSLDAQGSILALGKADLASRLGLQPASLVIHEEPLDRHGLNDIRTRRAASQSPCYSELIVADILYRNGSWGGQFLDTSFMLREFGASREQSRVTTGGGAIRLISFPAKEGEDTDAANADLNSAFRQGFESFAARVRRAHGS